MTTPDTAALAEARERQPTSPRSPMPDTLTRLDPDAMLLTVRARRTYHLRQQGATIAVCGLPLVVKRPLPALRPILVAIGLPPSIRLLRGGCTMAAYPRCEPHCEPGG